MQVRRSTKWVASSLVAFSTLLSSGLVWSETQNGTAEQASGRAGQFVDGIAAVVDRQVITLRQVDIEAARISKQLKAQNIPAPDQQTLRLQVLQRLIDETVQKQEGERLGIVIREADIDNAIEIIAGRNQLSPEQLRMEIENTGLAWEDYLQTLEHDLLLDQLRQRMVDERIYISDSEIDSFLRSQGIQPRESGSAAAAAGPEYFELAQILVRVPEGADSATVARQQAKAEELLARARSGADFAGLAAASSDGPEALDGGVLGARPIEAWPELFAQAVQSLQGGQVSELVRSGVGFHILKVVNRAVPSQAQDLSIRGTQGMDDSGPMMVTQTHARHILVKLSQVRDDDQALERITQLYQRLKNGESFEELARSYSEDSSAPQGGDLGWLTPGETVPAFEQAMDALSVGQISQPVRSQFGWHLILVEERRSKDMENEFRRMQARQHLFQQRVEPAFEDWLNQLRTAVYVDNRLEKAYLADQD